MNATMDDVAFDLLVAEQLNDAVPCQESNFVGKLELECPLEAQWVYTHGCGHSTLVCTPHRILIDDWMRKVKRPKCDICEMDVARPLPWLPL